MGGVALFSLGYLVIRLHDPFNRGFERLRLWYGGLLDWSLAASFIVGGMVGSVLGAAAARKLSAAKGRLNTVFAGLIVVVAGYMLYRNWMVFQS